MSGWKVKLWSFGHETFLTNYGATTGPCELTTGAISSVSWAPSTSSIVATEVVVGMTLYADVIFTTTNAIPSGGTAVITFQNVDLNTANYKQDIDGTATTAAYS